MNDMNERDIHFDRKQHARESMFRENVNGQKMFFSLEFLILIGLSVLAFNIDISLFFLVYLVGGPVVFIVGEKIRAKMGWRTIIGRKPK